MLEHDLAFDMEQFWIRNLVVISFGSFLASVSFNMTNPFIPMFVQELGQTEGLATLSSVALAASSLMSAVMAPVWGSLADKHGKKVMFIRAGIGVAVTYFLMAFVQTYTQYIVLRLLNGMLAGFIPACIMFIATNVPEHRVGYALGITQSAISVGTISGPAVGGFLAALVGMRYTMALSAVIFFIGSLAAIIGAKEFALNTDKNAKTDIIGDIKSVLAIPTLRGVIFALFLVNTALTVIQPVLALFISTMSFTGDLEVVTGYAFSIIGVSTAIGAPLIPMLHRRFSTQKVFYYGLGLSALLSSTQGMTASVMVLGVQRFFSGFANSAVTITANVLATNASQPELRGRTFGALNGISQLGNVIGPLIGGTIGDAMGYNIPFHVGGILFLAALALSMASLKNVETEAY